MPPGVIDMDCGCSVYVVRNVEVVLGESELGRVREIFRRYRRLIRILRKYYEYARRCEEYYRKYDRVYSGRGSREVLSRSTLRRVLEEYPELRIPSLTCYHRELLANVRTSGKQKHILAPWGAKKTVYINRSGELVIRGLNIRRELDSRTLDRIKRLEDLGFKPVVALIVWRGSRRLLVKIVFRGLSRVPRRIDVIEALKEDRLSIVSTDINSIHGIWIGLFRVVNGELVFIKDVRQNVRWVEVWQLQGRERELRNKLDKYWLSRREFTELRIIRKYIREKIRLNKNLAVHKVIELIEDERRLGRIVVLALEKCSKRDIERMLKRHRRLPRCQRWGMSWFMRGWEKRLRKVAWTYGAWFMSIDQYKNSVMCPQCRAEMKRVKSRIMKCLKCGKRWDRDKVALWNIARKALERVMKWLEENR